LYIVWGFFKKENGKKRRGGRKEETRESVL
jgi:hypothetical protein